MDSLPQSLDARAGTPISTQLGEFAASLRWEEIPADVVAQARRHMLDALGIALAASGFDFAKRTALAIAGLAGQGGGDAAHPVVGLPIRLPLRDAVLVNGSFIHGLD